MKHPILYRVGFYSCLVILCVMVLILLSALTGAPFKSKDMWSAYFHGCNLGSRTITEESVKRCSDSADVFVSTLDDLDRQMNDKK